MKKSCQHRLAATIKQSAMVRLWLVIAVFGPKAVQAQFDEFFNTPGTTIRPPTVAPLQPPPPIQAPVPLPSLPPVQAPVQPPPPPPVQAPVPPPSPPPVQAPVLPPPPPPVQAPVQPPLPPPVQAPVQPPLPPPVQAPVQSALDFHLNVVVPTVRAIESEIRDLVARDPNLGPKFVRLGFHDCTGGCDGCVDMTFHDNAGLEIPIDALRPIVLRHENPDLGISRADIWAMAAHVGADAAQARSHIQFDYRTEFIGRRNCETDRSACFDMNNVQRACMDTLGPHVHLPAADITTDALFHFFFQEFGFDVQQTVALMGAHTVGVLSREHSGYHGPNGWVRDNFLLDNDYYHELVGGQSLDAPLDQLIDGAPPWERFLINNEHLPDTPNLPAWRAFPPMPDGTVQEILMLNADIAIVRELDDSNLTPDGRVTCEFVQFFSESSGASRCPHAQRSLHFAAEYKFDNGLWLRDFHTVYRKMLNHGYAYVPDQQCPGDLCIYSSSMNFGGFWGGG